MANPTAHPIQPLQYDDEGVLRFRANAIVRHLVDWGREHGHGLNEIAMMEFSNQDWQQLAQLIGYSLDGYGDLSYVDEATYEEARKMAKPTLDEQIQDADNGIRDKAIETLALYNAAVTWRLYLGYTWSQLYQQEKARIYQRICATMDAHNAGDVAAGDPDPLNAMVERGERAAIGPRPCAHVKPEAMEARVQELADQLTKEQVVSMRLRAWQTDAARTLVSLRRHAMGQETLDGDCLSHWLDHADALTERRVLDEGADWR